MILLEVRVEDAEIGIVADCSLQSEEKGTYNILLSHWTEFEEPLITV
jgi:hypothetical protein